ncbi:MAG: hypothetical protein ABI972_26805 [Acidobacteriota bacterium]
MAHKWHTNDAAEPNANKSDTYRLGWGDVATEHEIEATARGIYLHVAGELYPAMGDELRAIAEELPPGMLPTEAAYLEPDAEGLLQGWARRWHLTRKGEVADWAVQAALDSIAQWRVTGEWVWCVCWGGCVPTPPDGDYDATLHRLVVEKRRRPRKEHAATSKAIAAYREVGYVSTPIRTQPEHMRWAARHRIGGEQYWKIARSLPAYRDKTPHEARDKAVELKHKAGEILRLVGLEGQTGRPPAR